DTGRWAQNRLFEGGDQVDRLVGAQARQKQVRNRAVSEAVLGPGGHGQGEGLHDTASGPDGLGLVAEVVAELVDTHGGVTVEGGGVELHLSDHACAGFLVGALVVDGGVVVELGGDRVGGQGVGDLDGGVDVETRDVGDHAAEQGDFGRVALGEHT